MDEACRHGIPGGVECVICTLDAEVARLTAERAAARAEVTDLLPRMDADAFMIAQAGRDLDAARLATAGWAAVAEKRGEALEGFVCAVEPLVQVAPHMACGDCGTLTHGTRPCHTVGVSGAVVKAARAALALAFAFALALALGGCPDHCQPVETPVCPAGMEAVGAAFERGFGCWNWTLVCAREGAPAKLRELQR